MTQSHLRGPHVTSEDESHLLGQRQQHENLTAIRMATCLVCTHVPTPQAPPISPTTALPVGLVIPLLKTRKLRHKDLTWSHVAEKSQSQGSNLVVWGPKLGQLSPEGWHSQPPVTTPLFPPIRVLHATSGFCIGFAAHSL